MTSPSLLDRCERRFGHLAIPGLLRVIAGFQALCFILIYLNNPYVEFLALTPDAWEQWQIWRFFTFCFIPNTLSIIWIIFAIMILLLIGDHLEAHWGKFRLNLYYAASVICLWAAVITAPGTATIQVGLQASTLLYSSLFLAFATLSPNYTFLLFFVFPVKVKWLAWLTGAILLFQFLTDPSMRLALFLALLPYGSFAVPLAIRTLRHGAAVSNRRATYKSNSLPQGEPFHQCAVCQRTDHSDPALEFRIAGDGEEYCADHLPKPAAG